MTALSVKTPARLVSILALFTCASLNAAENLDQREQELAAVNAGIAEIQSWLEQADASLSEEEIRLQTAEEDISRLSQSVATLEVSIDETTAELRSMQARSEQLQSDKAEQSAILMELLRAAYIAGEESSLKLLLNMENPARQDRMEHYYQRFTRAQVDTVAAYRETLAEIEQVNTGLRENLDALNDQQRQINAELAALNTAREDREAALASLSARIANRRGELEQLQIDREQLEQLIEQINQALDGFPAVAEGVAFSTRRGELPFPADGPVLTRFGARFGGGALTRQGISIGLEPGTPVRAIHPGRVVFADWLRGAGLLVILDHGDGYLSLYGNNQALAVQPGARAGSGTVLATSGQIPGSGGEPGWDGLYFEIRHQGEAQDPSDWLTRGN